MLSALKIFAGPEALAHIRNHGLSAADIRMVLGASGGPKWLSLAAIDRYLLSEWFAGRTEPPAPAGHLGRRLAAGLLRPE